MFDEKISNADHEWEQERHRRRVLLMQEMGKADRLERRVFFGFVIAGVLTVLAILGMML
jgi:hypothetical protein